MEGHIFQAITFFVELPGDALWQLVQRPGLVQLLARRGSALSIAMLDRSLERAQAMRVLSEAGIPLTAWLVLPAEEGYWLTADNAPLVLARYQRLRRWWQQLGLPLEAVGLDIEPPLPTSRQLARRGLRTLVRQLSRPRSLEVLLTARDHYRKLVQQIHQDGLRAESYQYPLLLDERLAGSTLLQRALGIVDLEVDREVVMLYSSVLPRPLGAALVDSFGPHCEAIGIGISGGGVELGLSSGRRLTLPELLEDICRAQSYQRPIYLFSLEGCLEQGYLEPLLEQCATLPYRAPHPLALPLRALRQALRWALRRSR